MPSYYYEVGDVSGLVVQSITKENPGDLPAHIWPFSSIYI